MNNLDNLVLQIFNLSPRAGDEPEQEEERGNIYQKGSNFPERGEEEMFLIFRSLILHRNIR